MAGRKKRGMKPTGMFKSRERDLIRSLALQAILEEHSMPRLNSISKKLAEKKIMLSTYEEIGLRKGISFVAMDSLKKGIGKEEARLADISGEKFVFDYWGNIQSKILEIRTDFMDIKESENLFSQLAYLLKATKDARLRELAEKERKSEEEIFSLLEKGLGGAKSSKEVRPYLALMREAFRKGDESTLIEKLFEIGARKALVELGIL